MTMAEPYVPLNHKRMNHRVGDTYLAPPLQFLRTFCKSDSHPLQAPSFQKVLFCEQALTHLEHRARLWKQLPTLNSRYTMLSFDFQCQP